MQLIYLRHLSGCRIKGMLTKVVHRNDKHGRREAGRRAKKQVVTRSIGEPVIWSALAVRLGRFGLNERANGVMDNRHTEPGTWTRVRSSSS